MTTAALLWKEMARRPAVGLLALAGITAAIALIVLLDMAQAAAERETRRNLRDLGWNVRIIPRDTDLDAYFRDGFSDRTLPEEAAARLASQKSLSYDHLVAVLERRLEVEGVPAVITGISTEAVGSGKSPMARAIAPGTVHLGHALAARLGKKKGDQVRLGAGELAVARVMPEQGTAEDVRVYASLADTQRAVELPGRISELKALDCLCRTSDEDPAGVLRREIEAALPEARVFHLASIADARARQRRMVENASRLLVPSSLAACVVWLFVLGSLEARRRRLEMGILRALGRSAGTILALFLGKAVLLGAAGGLAGWFLGTAIALRAGEEIFRVTAAALEPSPALLVQAVLIAVAVSVGGTVIPTLSAARRDPANVLKAE